MNSPESLRMITQHKQRQDPLGFNAGISMIDKGWKSYHCSANTPPGRPLDDQRNEL